ncbi:alpha/beta fold hydrolase [Flagellimonas olearia]|uniref:Alpha/beta fold hydrolase n=1 Tax=Flagellimonas olearia TaxID=552546 RepID=A0A6I1E9F3_9FLAO|nr:alpha/beta fold hydrolase [Allomuricauda olearia]KAB7530354.1 alpha/beta fold hydrolase [Allomuricauda olearia]
MKNFIITALLVAVGNFTIGQEQRPTDKNYSEEDIFFLNTKDTIHGKLILPNQKKDNLPVVVFVHGSGPEDYSSSNLYRPLWEEFTKAGFACFSWDKPGIGMSQGNWFDQSMDNRASEVIAAFKKLEQHPKVDPNKLGMWGISQAGWVIPKVAETMEPAFIITVSSPVTTAFDQEAYRLRSELKAEEFSKYAIDSALVYTHQVKDLVMAGKPFADFDALQESLNQSNWFSHTISGGKEIYRYLKVIIENDHIPNLDALSCPVLAIWGENDLLVPPHSSANQYKKVMEQIKNERFKMVIIPNADHTLTFNHTGRRTATVERREKYKDNPKKIFAPGYLKSMVDWLKGLGF